MRYTKSHYRFHTRRVKRLIKQAGGMQEVADTLGIVRESLSRTVNNHVTSFRTQRDLCRLLQVEPEEVGEMLAPETEVAA